LQIAFAPPLEDTSTTFAALWKEQGFLRGCYREPATMSPTMSPPTFRLDEPIPDELYREGLLLIVDRLTFDSDEEDRFVESLETALDYGDGKCFVLSEQQTFLFSRSLSCEYCNVHVPPLTTKFFRTDWINHVHLRDDVNSPTMSDLCRMTIAELIQFFEKAG
jgi:excinuclease UvrABC ATPase subunit